MRDRGREKQEGERERIIRTDNFRFSEVSGVYSHHLISLILDTMIPTLQKRREWLRIKRKKQKQKHGGSRAHIQTYKL